MSLRDYLEDVDLVTLKQGYEPTFCVANRMDVIDITLATKAIFNYMQRWRGSDEVSLSDHRHILYSEDFQE